MFAGSPPSLPGVVLVDDDDASYDDLALPPGWVKCSAPRSGLIARLNRAYSGHPDEDFYAVICDDNECTPGWDAILSAACKPHYVAWGDDGVKGERLCCNFFIGGDLVRFMGWLVNPNFGHLYGDRIWWEIAAAAGLARYHPEVKIWHRIVKDRTWQERSTKGDLAVWDKFSRHALPALIARAREAYA